MEKKVAIDKLSVKTVGGFTRSLTGSPAAECVNFISKNGALVDCRELYYFVKNSSRLELPGPYSLKVFYASTEGGEKIILAYQNEGEVSLYAADPEDPASGFTQIQGAALSQVPVLAGVNLYGKRSVIAVDAEGKAYSYDGNTLNSHTFPAGGVALIPFDGRFALVTSKKIHLSSPSLITSFTEYGSSEIDLPADFVAVSAVAYGNELLVAGHRGIIRISRRFDGVISTKSVSTGGERLLPETLAVGEEKVFIVSDAGLASYDGLGLEYSFEHLSPELGSGVCGFCWGKSYIAVVKTPENAQKRLIIFDGSDCSISDVPALSIAVPPVGDTPVILAEGYKYLCAFSGSPARPGARRIYKTARTDFGIEGKKALTSFSLLTNVPLTVIVEADGKKRAYRVKAGLGRRTVRTYISGEVFSFTFIAEGMGVEIAAPAFTLEY